MESWKTFRSEEEKLEYLRQLIKGKFLRRSLPTLRRQRQVPDSHFWEYPNPPDNPPDGSSGSGSSGSGHSRRLDSAFDQRQQTKK